LAFGSREASRVSTATAAACSKYGAKRDLDVPLADHVVAEGAGLAAIRSTALTSELGTKKQISGAE